MKKQKRGAEPITRGAGASGYYKTIIPTKGLAPEFKDVIVTERGPGGETVQAVAHILRNRAEINRLMTHPSQRPGLEELVREHDKDDDYTPPPPFHPIQPHEYPAGPAGVATEAIHRAGAPVRGFNPAAVEAYEEDDNYNGPNAYRDDPDFEHIFG